MNSQDKLSQKTCVVQISLQFENECRVDGRLRPRQSTKLGYGDATESKEILCQHLDTILLGDAGTLGSARDGQNHSESESTQTQGCG